MPMKTGTYRVMANKQLTRDVFDLSVYSPEAAAVAEAGQFAQLAVPGMFLRRPISICRVNANDGELRFVFQSRGEGTQKLSTLCAGDTIDMTAPLGHGFTLPASGKVLLVGGGIGVPPLLEAAARLGGRAVAALGFQSSENIILRDDFTQLGCKVNIATDDGSEGRRGLVTQIAAEQLNAHKYSCICACGPMAMLGALARLGEDAGIPVQVSLEAHMACGMGACLVCACKTRGRDGGELYSHVCKNGPVFDSREVVFT